MEIGPIFRALTRNKLGVILIALQIAFTMTVIINAIFIINERNRAMARPSGMDEENTFIFASIGFGEDYNEEVTNRDDLALLRNLPGVVDAAVTNSMPLLGGGSGTGVRLSEDEDQAVTFTAIYFADEHVFDAMGLNLIAGEYYSETSMHQRESNGDSMVDVTVISQDLAQTMFPELELNNVIGQMLYLSDNRIVRIVGIVERMQAPWQSSDAIERAMVVPENVIDGFTRYVVRTEPGERDRVMAQVEDTLLNAQSDRIIRDVRSLEQARNESYRIDSAMSTILWFVILMLVFITCMGIVGLAVFGINRRRKQIGTRRALGATKQSILLHFMMENALITGAGVVLGAVFTIGFSIVLTSSFNMPTMAWYYTPIGMLALIVVGQLAVLGPSKGAADTEPAIATRSI